MSFRWILFQCLLLLHLPHFICSFHAPFDFPIGNLTNSWTNSNFSEHLHYYDDGSQVRAILLNGMGTSFICGFYCSRGCTSFLFGVFVVFTNSGGIITMSWNSEPRIVWSANRNHPVGENATVQLTADGDLVLRDADGTLVWSTNTSGKSVLGVNMTENGNLVLFGKNNSIVWQSFDHPTDTLVLGQKLVGGQKLTANASASDWSDGGLYSLLVTNEGLVGFVESNGPQMYYHGRISGNKNGSEPSYIRFVNGSLAFFIEPHKPAYSSVISVPLGPSFQYIQLGFDGHLRLFQRSDKWVQAADLLKLPFRGYGECSYPTVCGSYGVCTNGQCSCPVETGSEVSYFRLLNDRQPSLGCSPITSLSCADPQNHILAEIKDISYFNLLFDNPYPMDNDINRCKQACLSNCSCKAVLHIFGDSPDHGGTCFLLSDVLSLITNDNKVTHVNSSAYIKVQLAQANTPSNRTAVLIWSSLGVFFTVIIIIIPVVLVNRRKVELQVTDTPIRFTYEELVSATKSFGDLLGKGGYGAVFKGELPDGTEIAVKSLDGENRQVESYFAEVKSVGSLHHINLIKLVGYCDDNTSRMLVYEYMEKGSLENWIFKKEGETPLPWEIRRSIILGIAKGLMYLHEECRQKIWHFDIKPQNILLDNEYNAKIADFGLAELVKKDERDISMTKTRGTPGYQAPEWKNDQLVITEKVDVFSFGVVVLEIVCGRMNNANPDTVTNQLLLELGEKAEKEQLFDLVNLNCEDMVNKRNEVVQMIILARECVQSDFRKRPSMSAVVLRVIEGPAASVENKLHVKADYKESIPLLGMELSTPLLGTEQRGGKKGRLLPNFFSKPFYHTVY